MKTLLAPFLVIIMICVVMPVLIILGKFTWEDTVPKIEDLDLD